MSNGFSFWQAPANCPTCSMFSPPITLMAKDGYLADLSDLDAVKALPAGYTASYTYDGKVYAYAPDAWVGGVFYNKALFADNNIAVPQTWADVLAAAKVFADKGITPISMGADELPDLIYWLHNTEVLSQDPTFDIEDQYRRNHLHAGVFGHSQHLEERFCGYRLHLSGYGRPDRRPAHERFCYRAAAMTISGPWAVQGFHAKEPGS